MDGKPQPRIHGVAVDAGSGLEAAIRAARGDHARSDDIVTFKRSVLTVLGPCASTVLVDATYGPELLTDFPEGCSPMLAFEADVYRISERDRMTVLPDNLKVADYPVLGVRQLKFFMYFAPDDAADLNARKADLVADLGEQCRQNDVQFLMEPLVYHPKLIPGTPEYAREKPDMVRRATETFADPRFQVDVLKVEIPVDLSFVDGFGMPDMSRGEALDAIRRAAQASADVPIVYLSAGVSFDWFEASLEMACEADVDFAGFMCGRAIWADAVDVFGREGETALRAWLETTGRERLHSLIKALN